ncbi:MAG: ABC transporter permease [Epsilonproteobacteria bacterium]|nr:ABC transporter permease [Campylobacterota bacterium]
MKGKLYNSKFVNKFIKHYLKYDKDNPFIFISALLALLGITMGVMVLMIAMGVMNGTHKEFKKRLFVMNYPLTIVSYTPKGVDNRLLEKIKHHFPEVKISPYYVTQVIAKNADSVNGAILYGVDFKKESEINSIFKEAYLGIKDRNYSKFSAITGDDLLAELGLKKGEKVTLFFSQQEAAGFGTMPLQKRFKIISSFNSGLSAYDKGIIYTTQEAFVKINKKNPNYFDGAHIYTEHPMELIEKIRKILPQEVGVEGWWEQNGGFFQAMQMEKKALFLVLLLIILVASLNIVSSLLMTVMSRRSEIALMRTLGATKQEVKAIFFKLGVIIGFFGIILGTILGLIGMWILTNYNIISLPEDIYGTSKLPIDLTLKDYISIIVGTSIIVLLSSIYPAIKASKTNILKVLRNE